MMIDDDDTTNGRKIVYPFGIFAIIVSLALFSVWYGVISGV